MQSYLAEQGQSEKSRKAAVLKGARRGMRRQKNRLNLLPILGNSFNIVTIMTKQQQPQRVVRQVKTLAEQAVELARQEDAIRAEIKNKQDQLESLTLLRCAIADEQRRGFGASAQKAKVPQADWRVLLALKGRTRKSHKRAQDKALKEVHLQKGWISWRNMEQILVAFQLKKTDPAELFWVRDALNEVLPHIRPVLPGVRVVGVSHATPFNLKYFLLCAEDNSFFKIVQTYIPGKDEILFQGPTLQSALEFIQKNIAA